jgi:hypothetical protein
LCSWSQTTLERVFWIRSPSWILYTIDPLFRYCNYYLNTTSSNFRLSNSKVLRQYLPILQSLIKCKKRSAHKLPMIRCLWLYRLFLYLFYTIRKWLLYSKISYLIRTYSSLHCSHYFSFSQCYKSNTLYYSKYHYLYILHPCFDDFLNHL